MLDIFEILGPIMVGPSSSHTAGAVRIGRMARTLLGEPPVKADIGLYGSFAETGRGHGTDRALVAGLLGMKPDDLRIPESFSVAKEQGLSFVFHPAELREAHPNTAVLTVEGASGKKTKVQAASIGGGRIRVDQLDGVAVDFTGIFNTLIVRHMDVPGELLQMAEKHDRTLLRAADSTVDVTSRLIDYLNRVTAPQITRHGVLMNIYGQGVLILGDSGIGKSETAIELLKRGHRLVADDAVEIRRVSNSLYGTAPEIIRHYIEIRGVGVIDVQQLFGMGAVQFDTEIDLVIQLEQWEDGKFYDRLGLGEEKYTILDVSLPIVTIPVRPGRNLAGIVEIATMKNRQMKYGYNAARDFVTQFDSKVDAMLHGNGAGQP